MDQHFGKRNSEKSPNQNSKKKKKSFKNENSLKDLLDSIKHINIHIIQFAEWEE